MMSATIVIVITVIAMIFSVQDNNKSIYSLLLHNKQLSAKALSSSALSSSSSSLVQTIVIPNVNANLTMTGTEKYVNSGWMFPKGAGLPGSSNTFGVTFQKAGTYNYLCLLHPSRFA
jgi:hypothetical protein